MRSMLGANQLRSTAADLFGHRAGHGVGQHHQGQRIEGAVVEKRGLVESVPHGRFRPARDVLLPKRVADAGRPRRVAAQNGVGSNGTTPGGGGSR